MFKGLCNFLHYNQKVWVSRQYVFGVGFQCDCKEPIRQHERYLTPPTRGLGLLFALHAYIFHKTIFLKKFNDNIFMCFSSQKHFPENLYTFRLKTSFSKGINLAFWGSYLSVSINKWIHKNRILFYDFRNLKLDSVCQK